MAEPVIAYVRRADATPEAELEGLASVYAFVLRCSEARRAEEKAEGRLPSPDSRDAMKGSSNDPDTLPAVRGLLSRYPAAASSPPEELAGLLFMLRFLPHQPEPVEVEAALETLTLEGVVAA